MTVRPVLTIRPVPTVRPRAQWPAVPAPALPLASFWPTPAASAQELRPAAQTIARFEVPEARQRGG